jgi:hypothetical protein
MTNCWLDYILANLDKPWNWYHISANPNIRWEDVIQNPNLPWKFEYLSRNPNITWEIIKANKQNSLNNWNYDQLSKNPNITLQFIMEHQEIPWLYVNVLKNKSVTYMDIVNNIEFFKTKLISNEDNLYFYYISKNPNITLSNVNNNPNKKWNYKFLSKHINITWETLDTEKNWSYYYLSRNPNMLTDSMKDITMLNKYMEGYLQNPNLLLIVFSIDSLIKINKLNDIEISYLSKNPSLTFADVEKNKEKAWDYINLSKNPMYAYKTYEKKESYMIEI